MDLYATECIEVVNGRLIASPTMGCSFASSIVITATFWDGQDRPLQGVIEDVCGFGVVPSVMRRLFWFVLYMI